MNKKILDKIKSPLKRILPEGIQKILRKRHGIYRYIYTKIYNYKARRLLGKAMTTPAYRCKPDSDVEINSLVCHNHISIYLLAIKSFLRFYDDIAVLAHDDGTLTEEDKKILREHIKGISITQWDDSERKVLAALEKYPLLRDFRKKKITQKQIFEMNIISKKKKKINLDSDTLFLKYPKEIIDWIEKENRDILYTYEEDPCGPVIREEYITKAQDKTPFRFAQNLCGGFVCYYRDIFNIELIDDYCRYITENFEKRREIYYAQPMAALLVGNSRYNVKILPDTYQNFSLFKDAAVFRHYFFSFMGPARQYKKDIKKIISELKSQKTPQSVQ